MSTLASQITGVPIVYSAFCSGADQRKYQCSASLAFVRGIHRWPVNSPHKEPVMRNIFPFDDVIMTLSEKYGLSSITGQLFLPITVTSHKRHSVLNPWKHDCSSNSLFRRRTNKNQRYAFLDICEENPKVDSPHKGPVMRKACPYHDVIMWLQYTITLPVEITPNQHRVKINHRSEV